ncbi:unnamed protein product [Lepeophtheirus salmonis]|uniref:(salmon louse) hypothetical protein n=1 Tax=Lepeophtheirus salmonis TaxID=72036 RepID=A0A7R8H954_LEPSM|nr:unnamed protein product [Lepeophtheirus salmonis]CAF2935443.1 unnamed protein product [Lepeophtheirus salmonis]
MDKLKLNIPRIMIHNSLNSKNNCLNGHNNGDLGLAMVDRLQEMQYITILLDPAVVGRTSNNTIHSWNEYHLLIGSKSSLNGLYGDCRLFGDPRLINHDSMCTVVYAIPKDEMPNASQCTRAGEKEDLALRQKKKTSTNRRKKRISPGAMNTIMLNGLDKSESSRIQFIIGQATSKNVFQVTHLLC